MQRSLVKQPSVKSANRALDIFELLAAEPNGLTISEISERLGFARSSTHGLVHTLYSRGYLSLDAGNRFYLGVRLIQLGLTVADRLELRSAAHGRLEQLVMRNNDTALLVVPDGGELLYVDKVISDTPRHGFLDHPPRRIACRPGADQGTRLLDRPAGGCTGRVVRRSARS